MGDDYPLQRIAPIIGLVLDVPLKNILRFGLIVDPFPNLVASPANRAIVVVKPNPIRAFHLGPSAHILNQHLRKPGFFSSHFKKACSKASWSCGLIFSKSVSVMTLASTFHPSIRDLPIHSHVDGPFR